MLLFTSVCYASKNSAKVFIVHSYCLDNICGSPQHLGVEEALAANGFVKGKNLEVFSYAMDTKKTNNTAELVQHEADLALSEIRKVKPDVVVVLDDNAFRTVGLSLAGTDTAVVYSGINAQPEDYNKMTRWMESPEKPGHNITGVYEMLHVADAFRVQKIIIPQLKRALIVSDISPTGKAIKKQLDLELENIDLGIEFVVKIASSWEEYERVMEAACADPQISTIYPAATQLKDKTGSTHSTSEIIKWTVDNCKKPGIAINYAFARLGMLGGVGVDFIAMGRQAGEMVAKILKGTSAGDIPIENAQRYALVFNLKRAEELGIEIPKDVLFAADTVYNE